MILNQWIEANVQSTILFPQFQFQNYAAIPEMVDNVKKLETDFKQLQFPQQESVGKQLTFRLNCKMIGLPQRAFSSCASLCFSLIGIVCLGALE